MKIIVLVLSLFFTKHIIGQLILNDQIKMGCVKDLKNENKYTKNIRYQFRKLNVNLWISDTNIVKNDTQINSQFINEQIQNQILINFEFINKTINIYCYKLKSNELYRVINTEYFFFKTLFVTIDFQNTIIIYGIFNSKGLIFIDSDWAPCISKYFDLKVNYIELDSTLNFNIYGTMHNPFGGYGKCLIICDTNSIIEQYEYY